MYQVGKETKYLKMMHGQPNIKIDFDDDDDDIPEQNKELEK